MRTPTPPEMQTLRFRLDLSAEKTLAYYRGLADQVTVRASDGRRVQFPAAWLRPYVCESGVHGLFEMRINDQNRLVDLRKIAG